MLTFHPERLSNSSPSRPTAFEQQGRIADEAARQAQRQNVDVAEAHVPGTPGRTPRASHESFKNGGMVRKTGLAKVHKGEVVIPKTRVQAVEKAVKKEGLKSIKTPSKSK